MKPSTFISKTPLALIAYMDCYSQQQETILMVTDLLHFIHTRKQNEENVVYHKEGEKWEEKEELEKPTKEEK